MFVSRLLRQKSKAALLHAGVSVLVAVCSAFWVFHLWYPSSLAAMLGGTKLFLLVVAAEVVLGPLMSLVIYSSRKSRVELFRDYSLVALIQCSALVYGLYVTYISRPVYMVFVVDRIEVISALELKDKDLSLAGKEFNSVPRFGVRNVCVNKPETIAEKNALLFSSVYGKDIELMPRYYRECRPGEKEKAAFPAVALKENLKGAGRLELYKAILPAGDEYTWLPVKSRFGAWIEIYPNNKLEHVYYLKIDPFAR